jgi:hypothetical protein
MSATCEKSSRKWVLPTVIALVILLPLILVLYRFVSFRSRNAAAIRRLEAKAKENNEPLTLNDLANLYAPIPDNENGALALLLVWEQESPEFWRNFREGNKPYGTKKEPKFDPALPILGSTTRLFDHKTALSLESRAAAEQFLKEQKDRMGALHAAVSYAKFRFPLAFTNGAEMLLPHLAEIKKDAQMFRIETLLAIEQGNMDAAIKDMGDTVRAANTLAEEPILISQLVRLACYNMSLDDAQRVLSHQPLSKGQLDQLDTMFDQLELTNALRMSLVGERVFGLVFFRDPLKAIGQLDTGMSGTPGPTSEVGVSLMSRSGIRDADQRLYMETLDQAIALSDSANPESLKRFKQVFDNCAIEARRMPPKPFSNMLLPALQKVDLRFALFEAKRRAAKTAVAIERFRASHNGQLPAKLDDLVPQFLPAVPNDPFDGKPLRFHSTPTGYVVYSVGENGRDDGGKERTGKVGPKDSDETFSVDR